MANPRTYNDTCATYNGGDDCSLADYGSYTYGGDLWLRLHPGGIAMASTFYAKITGSLTGDPSGASDLDSIVLTNSSAVGSATITTATTALASAATISIPSSGRFLVLIPASTNTTPLRFTGSTSETGMLLSSRGASFLSVVGGTTVYLYSTGGSAVGVRTLVY